MKKYFYWNGIANRSEFWGVNIVGMLLASLGYFISFALMVAGPVGVVLGVVLALAVMIAYGWLCISTSVRRCRSADINPWWTAAIFIPYVGLIVWITIGVLEPKHSAI